MIAQSSIGPDIDPTRCPKVVRRIFKGKDVDNAEIYKFKFGFIKRETEKVLEKRASRQLIYSESDYPWTNVPQRFPQPSKKLEELTFEEWLTYSWNKMSKADNIKLKASVLNHSFNNKTIE